MCCSWGASAQFAKVYGTVTDSSGQPIGGVSLQVLGQSASTLSADNGQFTLLIKPGLAATVVIGLLSQRTFVSVPALPTGGSCLVNPILQVSNSLGTFIYSERMEKTPVSTIDVNIKDFYKFSGPNRDISSLIKTQLGVTTNSELSTQYNVRGGNYDENLIYVNEIEIYRPQLVRTGQQEGLSFVNPDLVSGLKFSAGGFEASYGDKMSSVLDVRYKEPTKNAWSAQIDFLGATGHLEGRTWHKRLSYLVGARYRSNQYLLGSLDVQGNYKPRFGDFQTFLSYQVSSRFKIQFLANYARNRYLFIPQSQTTSFGTVTKALQLNVSFEGQELMEYTTGMGALSFVFTPSKFTTLRFYSSAFSSQELEYFDVIGAYRLSELDNNLGSDNFGKIKFDFGSGGYLHHARNNLSVLVANAGHRGQYRRGRNEVKWGITAQRELIRDGLREWKLSDSADYSVPYYPAQFTIADFVATQNSLSSYRVMGYLQASRMLHEASNMLLNFGLRSNYWTLNGQNVISPRMQFSFEPNMHHNRKLAQTKGITQEQYDSLKRPDLIFKAAVGVYYQPPFYREMRNMYGLVNTDLHAQRSIHVVVGGTYTFKVAARKFQFLSEAYYKKLDSLVPYELDNVRIRYYGQNLSHGYAQGIDFRLNGELVKGVDSWANLSFMKTSEDLFNDYYYKYYNAKGEQIITGVTTDAKVVDSVKVLPGYIPRPTDQRFNFSLFFQDYLPRNPSYKVSMTLIYGSKLPFGPSDYTRYRDVFRASGYRRVDIGFSKSIIDETTKKTKAWQKNIQTMWLSLEVFNLFQINNTVSFTWVKDVSNLQYAVPNYLTGRRINLRLYVYFGSSKK